MAFGMNLDDKICYCYHVSLRKLVNYVRRERPRKASQMSNCLGAGTGCGWCIPILKRIHERVAAETDTPTAFHDLNESGAPPPPAPIEGLPATAEEYAAARGDYLKSDRKNSF